MQSERDQTKWQCASLRAVLCGAVLGRVRAVMQRAVTSWDVTCAGRAVACAAACHECVPCTAAATTHCAARGIGTHDVSSKHVRIFKARQNTLQLCNFTCTCAACMCARLPSCLLVQHSLT
jgi:hypothetical protein